MVELSTIRVPGRTVGQDPIGAGQHRTHMTARRQHREHHICFSHRIGDRLDDLDTRLGSSVFRRLDQVEAQSPGNRPAPGWRPSAHPYCPNRSRQWSCSLLRCRWWCGADTQQGCDRPAKYHWDETILDASLTRSRLDTPARRRGPSRAVPDPDGRGSSARRDKTPRASPARPRSCSRRDEPPQPWAAAFAGPSPRSTRPSHRAAGDHPWFVGSTAEITTNPTILSRIVHLEVLPGQNVVPSPGPSCTTAPSTFTSARPSRM